jgi:glycosyltransferase involved in cell wall biosynthesis
MIFPGSTTSIKQHKNRFARTKAREEKTACKSNPPLRIGVNASMLDAKPTGVGIFTYNLINAMHKLVKVDGAFDLTVYSPVSHNLDPGLRIHTIPGIVQSSAYPKTSALSRQAWNQFIYPLAARQMDVLLNPSTHGHLWGQHQVLTIHDLLSLRFPDISTHQRIYFQKLLPAMIRKSTRIIAVSESTKADIMHYFGTPEDKIHVVHNGYDSKTFKPARGSSAAIREAYGVKDYILAVGPTYPHKNFTTLLKAYALLQPSIRQQHPLLIAGGRPAYLNELRKKAANLGISAHLHFTGYVPQHLMPALYHEARMLVFPSLYEGFGIPLLEAMACGCPVISSNASSMPEVCGTAASYANPDAPESFYSAINRLLTDEAHRKHFSSAGLTRCRQFSWERSAATVIDIVKDIFSSQNNSCHV